MPWPSPPPVIDAVAAAQALEAAREEHFLRLVPRVLQQGPAFAKLLLVNVHHRFVQAGRRVLKVGPGQAEGAAVVVEGTGPEATQIGLALVTHECSRIRIVLQ